MRYQIICLVVFIILFCKLSECFREYSKQDIKRLREEVRQMFQHAYNGYLKYASGYDELRPLSCDGVNTWGNYHLTLIDALDTLVVMGNYSEFRRVVKILVEKSNFDADINISVFETNIRIVGGLLSAHLMSRKAGLELEEDWPCNGPLLRLAEDVAKRLLPAFDTKTGMPYGTVNLRYGVPPGETSVTCTAGVGTFIVEFGTLSRLTGNPIYEEVALNAIYALWNHRSPIGLFGNHIDVQTGRWTAQDSGIGAGVDSFYEYLVKGAILLNRPELLQLFHEGRKSIDKYLRKDDWHVWVSMNKGQVTLPVFQSLEAYWPGVLSLVGETSLAMRTLHNYHSVWKQYGFLPEFYNIPNGEASINRENYPLRPELIESVMYLYRATHDPYLLEVGEDILKSIQYSAKTPCGYATIKNVRDHRKEDRMESFFLAETTKYLYLLFDEKNFLHNEGEKGTIITVKSAIDTNKCVIETGGYIFNTEAHPVDPSALECCSDKSRFVDFFENFNYNDFIGENLKLKYRNKNENLERNTITNKKDAQQNAKNLALEILNSFEKIEIEFNVKQKEQQEQDENVKLNNKATSINVLDNEQNSLVENELPSFIISAVQEKNIQERIKKNLQNSTIFDDNILEEFSLLEDKKFVKWMHELRKAIKLREEQNLQLLKTISLASSVSESELASENITLTDFWDEFQTNDSTDTFFTPMLNETKYSMEIDVYEDVITNLAKLQKEYFINTSKILTSDYLLHKIIEFLDPLSPSPSLNVDSTKLNEIDKSIYQIMLKAQNNFEKQLSLKTVDIQLYKYIYKLVNVNNKNILKELIKRIKQAVTIKSEILKNEKNNTVTSLKFEIFHFLHTRTKLQLSYRKLLLSSKMKLKTNSTNEKKNDDDLISATKETFEEIELKNANNSNKIEQNTDDIIQTKSYEDQIENYVEKTNQNENEQITGVGTVEQINLDDETASKEYNEIKKKLIESTSSKIFHDNSQLQQPSSSDQLIPSAFEDFQKNSIISEFLKTIIKSTLPMAKSKFNSTELLQRIRDNGIYLNQTQNFELFYCKAQPYLNRFSLRGQFFDNDDVA